MEERKNTGFPDCLRKNHLKKFKERDWPLDSGVARVFLSCNDLFEKQAH